MSLGQRVFTILLKLLPVEFRGDFGGAMMHDAEYAQSGGAFWWRESGGLVAAVIREHLDALRQDVKYAVRMMRRSPGFTAAAILILGVGTGANVAMFSVVDAVMLRSPFVDQTRIARVRAVRNGRPEELTVERYRALAAAPGPLAAVAMFGGGNHILTGSGDPRRVQMECVSASMFDVLGRRPLLGSPFSSADDRPGAEPKVVLAYTFWQQLGGSPNIVGTSIVLNDRPVVVTGVMPLGYTGPLSRLRVDGWMPIGAPVAGAGLKGCELRGAPNVFARVAAPLTLEDAQKSFAGLAFLSIAEQTFSDWRTPFAVLSGAVAFVLLIACANVGGLQLERTLARQRELAVRTSLGAGGWRLARQILTENLVLALAGAVAGVLAAQISLQAIVSLLPPNTPHLREIVINGRVLAVAIFIAIVTGLVAGLFPLFHLRKAAVASGLAGAGRATSRLTDWTRRSLIVGEIALSIVVLIGAGLMIQTFLTLRPTAPGFDPAHKLVNLVRLPGATHAEAAAFFDELFVRVRAIPGVRGVTAISDVPMSGGASDVDVTLGGSKSHVWESRVTPEFLALMKIGIVQGRGIEVTDSKSTEPVAIVNVELARRLRPRGAIVGSTIVVVNPYIPGDQPVTHRVVGVFAPTRNSGGDTRIRPELYRPYAQDGEATMNVIIDTDAGPDDPVGAAYRAQLRSLRADLAIEPVVRLTEIVNRQVVYPRLGAWLLGVFAAMAVGLAAVGLMATLGWWVRQRTRELGVRVALGASPRRLVALVLRQGATLGLVGIALGCAVAAGLTRYLQGWIYGVTPLDFATFAACAGSMVVVALVAIFFPTRRAARVDPIIALRAE